MGKLCSDRDPLWRAMLKLNFSLVCRGEIAFLCSSPVGWLLAKSAWMTATDGIELEQAAAVDAVRSCGLYFPLWMAAARARRKKESACVVVGQSSRKTKSDSWAGCSCHLAALSLACCCCHRRTKTHVLHAAMNLTGYGYLNCSFASLAEKKLSGYSQG